MFENINGESNGSFRECSYLGRKSDFPLTVLIPTYNRREPLTATLKALSAQENQNFNVVISDNHSNYSIEEEIFPLLPKDFLERVTVHHQPFNVGSNQNIMGMFLLCKTEWGWLLGDDDFVQKDAINTIYSNIRNYPDVAVFWFSVSEGYKNNAVLGSVEQLQEFMEKRKNMPNNNGDFYFCSNKVYKMTELVSMNIAFTLSSNAISHCNPIIEMLKVNKKLGVIGIDNAIVLHNGKGTWDLTVAMVVTEMKTFIDYPTGLEWKKHCNLVRNVMLSPMFLLISYVKLTQLPWNYKSYLKTVYTSCYRFCYAWPKRLLIKPLFWLASYYVGWKILKGIYIPLAALNIPLAALKGKIRQHPVLFERLRELKRKVLR